MKNNIFLLLLLLTVVFIFSCKKEEPPVNSNNAPQWMRVLEDTMTESTDDDTNLAENGKIITDNSDNIYVYYYLKNKNQTVITQYNLEGLALWKKELNNCKPMDMVLLNDGSLIVAVFLPESSLNYGRVMKLVAIRTNGSVDSLFFQTSTTPAHYALNATLWPLPDNSIIISSAVTYYAPAVSSDYQMCFAKINPSFQVEWLKFPYNHGLRFYTVWEQNSIIPTGDGKYLFEFSVSRNLDYCDSISYGLFTGILNSDGIIDTSYFYQTGYIIFSTGRQEGIVNKYCRGLMTEGTGKFIYHYSSPRILSQGPPTASSAFLHINSEAIILDTIPIPLPDNYRILFCTQNNGRFLLAAYKNDLQSSLSDYTAGHTLFLTGGSDWRTASTFTFQEFYSDFFPSSAPTSDGGFVVMGKIQSFNGPANKLILIKWNG